MILFKLAKLKKLLTYSALTLTSILVPVIFFTNANGYEYHTDRDVGSVEAKSNVDTVRTKSIYNPFVLLKDRIVPESMFQIKINDKWFKKGQEEIIDIALLYEVKNEMGFSDTLSAPIINYFFKQIDNDLLLFAEMVPWNMIKRMKTQSAFRGWLKPYKARIKIVYQKIENDKVHIYTVPLLPVEIPRVLWAYFWGILAVIFSFIIIWSFKIEPLIKQDEFDKDSSRVEWEKLKPITRFFLYPLNLTVTPLNTYSISITQILIWTFITIFGLVYVFFLSSSILNITPQMLMLLGIGGGTALAAKINALSKVNELPEKYLKLVERKRIPKLKDLITIGGQPNIFKFQMLVFTLLTAYFVLIEITKNHAFPEIPENLIALLGISSFVYLGNEFTHKSVWDKIKNKQEEIENYAKDNQKPLNDTKAIKDLNIPQVEQLENLLKKIYS